MSSIATTEIDRYSLETLKIIHNRGAELYNAGEHVAAFRLYQGALLSVRSFLKHRPQVQAHIEEGLSQVEESVADDKLKAYRLHEVIEQTRADLKTEVKKQFNTAERAALAPPPAAIAGKLLIRGRPLGNVVICFCAQGTADPIATTTSAVDGRFVLAPGIKPGDYVATISGPEIPSLYFKSATSPLSIKLEPGVNSVVFEVK